MKGVKVIKKDREGHGMKGDGLAVVGRGDKDERKEGKEKWEKLERSTREKRTTSVWSSMLSGS